MLDLINYNLESWSRTDMFLAVFKNTSMWESKLYGENGGVVGGPEKVLSVTIIFQVSYTK